jgi:hypothetical protein
MSTGGTRIFDDRIDGHRRRVETPSDAATPSGGTPNAATPSGTTPNAVMPNGAIAVRET